MKDSFSSLTPEEKREFRLSKVLKGEGINFPDIEAKDRYLKRAQRVVDAYSLKQPDRVPVRMTGGFFAAALSKISGRELIYDAAKQADAYVNILNEFDVDLISAGPPLAGAALEALDFQLYKWPGYGLSDDVLSHQYVEGEYMKADEYEDLIDDPTDFWLRKYLPRIFGTLSPFSKLTRLTEIYELPGPHVAFLARPEVRSALRSLLHAGDEVAKMGKSLETIKKAVVAQGFPKFLGGQAKAPFDIIGDTLRGTTHIMMDLFRRPDQLKEAMERLVPITVKGAVEAADASGCPVVMLPLHKGADGFLSEKQFEEFYWPSLRKVIMGMIEEGVIPQLFAEGSYNSRLGTINDLPEKSVSWFFDQTDMVKAKQMLGDNCLVGNVPVSILTNGTPEEVDAYCKHLIETCGPGGGFILAPGATSENARPDNLKAMIHAAKKYSS